jgi:alanyl-tRNA synthetase
MTGAEVRQSFLGYFARHGHEVVSSSSLVPADDPTLLFTNAGMNQFKDYFLGRRTPEYRRAVTVQKCMRVSGKHNDLENVGPSLRHHTFFEMLGNFSFGNYFKHEAIPYAWELLTKVWNLPPDRLYPTIFGGEGEIPRDDQAFAIWKSLVPPSRIAELGLAENFWQMGDTGPCGRCSEILFFRGEDVPCREPVCRGIQCDCERYVEVWNNVFMEFDRQADGTLNPLPAPSIDTGMGLERVTSVIQGKISNYDTDLFTPILSTIGRLSGREYTGAIGQEDHPDVSMRVIADHIRATSFLIADGVLPSNEGRGYVLRKIMRRAMRHGKKLGLTQPFLAAAFEPVLETMGGVYPELREKRTHVANAITAEETRFDVVLTSGLPKVEDLLARTLASGSKVVPGEDVFRLYDSLGVPVDFVEDLATQRGLTIDQAAYAAAMEAQRDRARASSKFKVPASMQVVGSGAEAPLTDTFEGYETTTTEGCVVRRIYRLTGDKWIPQQTLERGEVGAVILDRTPFYVEAGGQVSDTGELRASGLAATVQDVKRQAAGAARFHIVSVDTGTISEGDTVTASVDATVRDSTRRNHTATHLLHAALRRQFGGQVRQAGSLVAPDRLRFDFTHGAPLTDAEKRDIERVVNEQVYRNTRVETEERSTDEAIKGGAMALFGEKYGDTVRVVSIPGFSIELCGGTHVRATGDIGPFVITEESSVAAGVRRIEALTGAGAVTYVQTRESALDQATDQLGVPADQVAEALARLQAEVKRLARENEQLKMKLALGGGGAAGSPDDDVLPVGDAKLVTRRVSGLEKAALRSLSDSLRDRLKRGVVVLAGDSDGKVHLLVSVTKDLADRVSAGQLVKELAPIIGGGGGGRADFAEAGGKDPSRVDEMLAKARETVTRLLGAEA